MKDPPNDWEAVVTLGGVQRTASRFSRPRKVGPSASAILLKPYLIAALQS